jgi:type IV pilus assembly protein PilV
MSRLNRQRPARRAARGFSLVEIMVAVVVICVGLLGIAKMQALAVSSTTTARLRAMAAFQAASLAAIMHSNRTYWATAAAVANSPTTIFIPAGATAATITYTPAAFVQASSSTFCIDTVAQPAPKCPGTAGAAELAGMDITRWAIAMIGLLPNLTTTINCQGAIQPPSCIIQMQWTEQTGTVNSSENSVAITSVAAGALLDYYTLYVAP